MKLDSPTLRPGARIDPKYTCEGADRSPPLAWSEVPGETQSFALLVFDLDAPREASTHWVLYDVDPDRRSLDEQTTHGRRGRNDFESPGWSGPCPPQGDDEHRYVFALYALDMPHLGLEPGAHRQEVERRMEGHVLEEARLTVRCVRTRRAEA